jgi:hypothetical protein
MRNDARPVISFSPKRIVPARGRRKPVMRLSRVVLPDPLPPSRQVAVPHHSPEPRRRIDPGAGLQGISAVRPAVGAPALLTGALLVPAEAPPGAGFGRGVGMAYEYESPPCPGDPDGPVARETLSAPDRGNAMTVAQFLPPHTRAVKRPRQRHPCRARHRLSQEQRADRPRHQRLDDGVLVHGALRSGVIASPV